MRLTHKELSLTVAMLTLSVGLIVMQPASAAIQSHAVQHKVAKQNHNCNKGCTFKDGTTFIIPDRTIVIPPTTVPITVPTTIPPVTTTTVKPYVVPVVVPKAPVITTTTIAPTPVNGNPYGVTAADVAAWTRVSVCEEGGNWHIRGGMYSGGLGISNTNWVYFSRGMGLPANAADATPIQQIAVAKRINAGYAVPDQYGGCAAW